jgi:glycosyltransferase involved in cell wall biosynthesis
MNLGYCLQGQPYSQTAIQLEMAEWKRRGYLVDIIDIEKPLNRQVIKNCDFIICHFSYQGIWASRWGIPYAVYPHAYDIWKDQGMALHRATSNNNCKWIACESKYHKKKFQEWGLKKPLNLIYGAIDVDYFKRTKPLGDKVVGGGRLREKKGLIYAVKGFRDITIFGKGEEIMNQLKQENPNATYLGFISKDEYKNLLENSWLFVSPNIIARDGDMDGIPATIMESMLMELQILTTSTSGIPELSPYVHMHTTDEIASGDINIEKERNIGGRDLIRTRHSPKAVVDRMLVHIEESI